MEVWRIWKDVQNLDGKDPLCNELAEHMRVLYARSCRRPPNAKDDEEWEN